MAEVLRVSVWGQHCGPVKCLEQLLALPSKASQSEWVKGQGILGSQKRSQLTAAVTGAGPSPQRQGQDSSSVSNCHVSGPDWYFMEGGEGGGVSGDRVIRGPQRTMPWERGVRVVSWERCGSPCGQSWLSPAGESPGRDPCVSKA